MCINIENSDDPGDICLDDEDAKNYLNLVISSRLPATEDLKFQGRLCFCSDDKCNTGNTMITNTTLFVYITLCVLLFVFNSCIW